MKSETDIKINGLIGLAKKAGMLQLGSLSCEITIKSKRAHLILLSATAGPTTKKNFRDKAVFYSVPCIELGGSDFIINVAGDRNISVAVVTSPDFSRMILDLLGVDSG